MIGRIETFLRSVRLVFSRSQWAIRLLRLSHLNEPSRRPGLVMVQIDGLSLTQFNKASQRGHLPFLNALLSRERYQLHHFYSGLPSNTPAVQGELFYGIKGCVPSFSFIDRQKGQLVKMFDAPYVEEFEPRLMKQAEGLLTGGSSYSNIYSGGAKESHFCWANLGWGGVVHAVNPVVFPFLVILYIDIFIRTGILLVLEFFIALFECLKGTMKGRIFFEELRFVWLRVLICVFLREVMVAGACMDIIRGLPIIHLNFLGYDEQAHCRGPFSRYAHWSLQGIDDAIKRIDHVMKQAPYRQYDLWVYGDHGQERTVPYMLEYGHSIEDAVKKLFDPAVVLPPPIHERHKDWSGSRARLLNSRKKIFEQAGVAPVDFAGQGAIVTAMGPLGQIYVNRKLESQEFEFYAKKLVSELHIPLVLVRQQVPKVLAYTPQGVFTLPEQMEEVFGADHPFIEEFKEDVLRICHHPDAGEFIIAGWSKGSPPISFPLEYGAHAGMGVEETRSFALLPMDAPVQNRSRNYLRPLNLREAALKHLNKQTFEIPSARSHDTTTLRIMSYNVHGCLGMDGEISPERIARVIARHNPDVIALQELDAGRSRSHGIKQAEKIADYLEMKYHFHPVICSQEEQFGNAILSRYPLTLNQMGSLPRLANKKRYEPRGAMGVFLDFQGVKVQIINTHLSIWPKERMLQADALLKSEWLNEKVPTILCGDFNAMTGSLVYRKICEQYKDSHLTLNGKRSTHTWFGRYPLTQIDHIFVTSQLRVKAARVSRTYLDQIASDHLPLISDISFI